MRNYINAFLAMAVGFFLFNLPGAILGFLIWYVISYTPKPNRRKN